MSIVIPGTFRDGHIELSEQPPKITGEARVLVTFLEPGNTALTERGITPEQAAELRARLATFAEEWDSPEMSAYDNYDANRPQSETR